MVLLYMLLAVLTVAVVYYLKPSSGGQLIPATDITVTARAPVSSCSSTATGRHRTSRRAQREKKLKERNSQKEEEDPREKKLPVPVCPIVEPPLVQPVPPTPPPSFEEAFVIVQAVAPVALEVCAQSVVLQEPSRVEPICPLPTVLPIVPPVQPVVEPIPLLIRPPEVCIQPVAPMTSTPEVCVQPEPVPPAMPICSLPTASPEKNVATARLLVDTETKDVKTATQIAEMENPSMAVSMTSAAPEEKKKKKTKKGTKKKTTSKPGSKEEKKNSKKKSTDGKTK